jgi:tetratricopeptide (TPR) repeat protein
VKPHILKGNRLVKKGDLAGARAEFESAQIDAPEAAFIPYNIGNTHYLEGDFDEARKSYERAALLAKDPDLKSKIAYNLGHLKFSMGDREGAIQSFKDCLKLNSKDMDAKYNIEYIRAGKTPKNPPKQKPQGDKNKQGDKDKQEPQKGDGNSQDKKDGDKQDQPAGGDDEKKGGLSKEDAERVLQMMQDQESEKMKNEREQRARQAGSNKDKDKQNGSTEDW